MTATVKEPCTRCKKNVATETWSSDMMSFVHGMSSRWCALCCVQEQLDFALEAAARVEKLQKERDEAFRTVTPITDEEREVWYQTHPLSRYAGMRIAVWSEASMRGGQLQDSDVAEFADTLEELMEKVAARNIKRAVVFW